MTFRPTYELGISCVLGLGFQFFVNLILDFCFGNEELNCKFQKS